MIKKLLIQNYALIGKLEIDFHSGFSVVTGETGAGKSIILGALSLILGQRADSKSVKEGESHCVIEGCFDLSAYRLRSFFDDHNLDYDPQACILRRELMSSGKSRSFINDTPVSLVQLKDLGSRLIDIHSQHQNLLLGDDRFQLRVLDLLAGNENLFREYQGAYSNYKKRLRRLDEKRELLQKNRQEEDYLRFQYQQLDEAGLTQGEQEELEREQDLLTHAEEIKGALCAVSQLLDGDEGGVLPLLKEAVSRIRLLSRIYPDAGAIADRLESDYIDLKDIATDADDRQERVCFDPERVVVVQERLDLLYRLQQKHQLPGVLELIALKREIESQLVQIDHSDEEIMGLENEIQGLFRGLSALALQLTESRKEAAPGFAIRLQKQARSLGMANMRFEAAFVTRPHLEEYGAEQVQFLFAANKNQSLQPISDVASGGEISRVMLCLKALIAGATALPTVIFDEIDTGVSGEIADKMGDIMRDMSRHMQVIGITHLPQVAAKGEFHYQVYKEDDEQTTATYIRLLAPDERHREIAGMLSGAVLTDAALKNARMLLEHAATEKK